MATCGYLCPVCEGRGFLDDATDCSYCTNQFQTKKNSTEISDEDWIAKVHNSCGCSDIGREDEVN